LSRPCARAHRIQGRYQSPYLGMIEIPQRGAQLHTYIRRWARRNLRFVAQILLIGINNAI
jgi:hypothetical protein